MDGRSGGSLLSDEVDLVGEVLEADVRQRRFQLWTDGSTGVPVDFSPQHEGDVTHALREHRTVRLRVKGRGEFSPRGSLIRVTEVTELALVPASRVRGTPQARPIEDILAELAGEVPKEDWDRLPSDLTDQLDHYLYGTPRR